MAELTTLTATRDNGSLRWFAEHREQLRTTVRRQGALLVRGLGLDSLDAATEAAHCVTDRLMTEHEGFTPRVRYAHGVYSEPQWPADQPMCMHHELSYAPQFPGLLVFVALRAAGEITLADGAAVLRDLPPGLVERFETFGWELTRNHSEVIGLPWREAFGTGDRSEVERYCRRHGIRWEWSTRGGLRTVRRLPAVHRHPVTGDRVWFNQVAFLNEWTMDPAVRDYLVAEFGAGNLPHNTRSGDGRPLDPAEVDLINDVYARHTIRAPWQAGDLLLVDNCRTAHSREPFTGARDVVVALGDPLTPGPPGR